MLQHHPALHTQDEDPYAVPSSWYIIATARPEPDAEYWHQLDRARGNDRAPSLPKEQAHALTFEQSLTAQLGMSDPEAGSFAGYADSLTHEPRRELFHDGRHMSQVDLQDVIADYHVDDALDERPFLWDQGAGNMAASLASRAQVLIVIPMFSGIPWQHENMQRIARLAPVHEVDERADGQRLTTALCPSFSCLIRGQGAEWLRLACVRAQEALHFGESEEASRLLLSGLQQWRPYSQGEEAPTHHDRIALLRAELDALREQYRDGDPSLRSTVLGLARLAHRELGVLESEQQLYLQAQLTAEPTFVQTDEDRRISRALDAEARLQAKAEQQALEEERAEQRILARCLGGDRPTRKSKTIRKDVRSTIAVKRYERLSVDDVMRLCGKPRLRFFRDGGRVMVEITLTLRKDRPDVSAVFGTLPSGQPSPACWAWARSHFERHPMALQYSKDRGLSKTDMQRIADFDIDEPLRDLVYRAAGALPGSKVALSQAIDADAQLMSVPPRFVHSIKDVDVLIMRADKRARPVYPGRPLSWRRLRESTQRFGRFARRRVDTENVFRRAYCTQRLTTLADMTPAQRQEFATVFGAWALRTY